MENATALIVTTQDILSNQLIDALAGIYCLSDTFTEDYINREINMEKRSK